MNKTAVVTFLCIVLAAANVEAQQTCTPGVPASTPNSDFTDHGDGTVTHKTRGLMWKKCPEGLSGPDCSVGALSSLTWQQALQLADGHSHAGQSDWRLPNIKELASIVELSCQGPATNLSLFPNVFPIDSSSQAVWSGTPSFGDDTLAWYVSFNDGYSHFHLRSHLFHVWLVRDGQ